MRIHRFIIAAFVAYAVLTNACMLPTASAAAPQEDPHVHHGASHEADDGVGAHHASDCAHGHCLGHGLPAAITEDSFVQAGSHAVAPASFRATFASTVGSIAMPPHPLRPPDPPGHVRTVVLRY